MSCQVGWAAGCTWKAALVVSSVKWEEWSCLMLFQCFWSYFSFAFLGCCLQTNVLESSKWRIWENSHAFCRWAVLYKQGKWRREGEEVLWGFIPSHRDALPTWAAEVRCYITVQAFRTPLCSFLCPRTWLFSLFMSSSSAKLLSLPRAALSVNTMANNLPFCFQCQFVLLGPWMVACQDFLTVSWYLSFFPFAAQEMEWLGVLTYNLSSLDTSLSWTGHLVSECHSRRALSTSELLFLVATFADDHQNL